jgi:hypothetical protein
MNTEIIKQTSRAKYLHSLAKLAAKESHTAQMLLTAYGGTFRVTAEWIAFLSIKQLGDAIIVLDIFENPIEVDRISLLNQSITLYETVMQSWLDTVTEINKKR